MPGNVILAKTLQTMGQIIAGVGKVDPLYSIGILWYWAFIQ